ncbi:MAG: hypothetical protein KatS3mg119_1719 [Rhodothalassiaceae bacterium]|nr:MAG: hypothetical protein KatS3mg119_1719 [Rhodothalassiaceae bacterium]
MAPALGALILAGGRSRRMERDKALLVWRGRTLLDHAHDLAAAMGAAPILLSGRPGGLPDPVPDLGPIGGVLSLARHWRTRRQALPARWLLLPVDMPALDVAALAPLLADGVEPVTHYAGRPLPAVLRLGSGGAEAIIEAIEGAVLAVPAEDDGRAGRRLSLHRLWARLGAPALPLAAELEEAFCNINTPAEWTRFLSRHGDAPHT